MKQTIATEPAYGCPTCEFPGWKASFLTPRLYVTTQWARICISRHMAIFPYVTTQFARYR